MKQFKYVIKDEQGIHARPAGLLVKKANEFASKVTISKDGKDADAKRIFGIMGLAAKSGHEITITCEGDDEAAAATALETFLKENL
jgi:phosphocarrier protein